MFSSVLGSKSYELKDHLGNVRAVITDQKILEDVDGNDEINLGDYYTANVVSFSDYFPGGMLQPNRHGGENYRFGFGSHENDNEVKGKGNHMSFGNYGYDTRLMRRMNIDPLIGEFPWMSSYAVFNNNPIYFADLTGLSPEQGGPGDPEFIGTLSKAGDFFETIFNIEKLSSEISSFDKSIESFENAINDAKKELLSANLKLAMIDEASKKNPYTKYTITTYNKYVNTSLVALLEITIIEKQNITNKVIDKRNKLVSEYNALLESVNLSLSLTDGISSIYGNTMYIYEKNSGNPDLSISINGTTHNYGGTGSGFYANYSDIEKLDHVDVDFATTGMNPNLLPKYGAKGGSIKSSKTVIKATNSNVIKLVSSETKLMSVWSQSTYSFMARYSKSSGKTTWTRFLKSQKGQYSGKDWMKSAMQDYIYYKKMGLIK